MFEAVICINALEHFERDGDAVAKMDDLLSPGGGLCVYVPARSDLFGDWDRSVGHYRRYDSKTLGKLMQEAGLLVMDICYSDPLGGVAWYLSSNLGVTHSVHEYTQSWSLRFFDWLCVPLQKNVDRVLCAPGG